MTTIYEKSNKTGDEQSTTIILLSNEQMAENLKAKEAVLNKANVLSFLFRQVMVLVLMNLFKHVK